VARFLMVTPPFPGHVLPLAGIARELEGRGHAVAWVAHESRVGHHIGSNAKIFAAGDEFLAHRDAHPEREVLRGREAADFYWDHVVIPMAVAMRGPLHAAVDAFGPDVIVSDQQAMAGAVVARERGLPWVISASSSLTFTPLWQQAPALTDWVLRHTRRMYEVLGIPELIEEHLDRSDSPFLTLLYATPELLGELGDQEELAYVGPIIDRRPPVEFPWEWLDRHDTNVLVTLGTQAQGVAGRLMRAILDAVAGQPYGVVVVPPDDDDVEPADNILVRRFVPQLDLLPRMDAVLCHAGHNTTVESLAHGVPLVCTPIRHDQPVIAGLVTRAGAGVRLKTTRAKPPDVAAAIDTVLHDPSYRAAAGRIAESFRAAGGASAAADRIEVLASVPAGRHGTGRDHG
jgi:MGT family glycosyltransferase